MKRFGKGLRTPAEPSRDELEREASNELRKISAGAAPRGMSQPSPQAPSRPGPSTPLPRASRVPGLPPSVIHREPEPTSSGGPALYQEIEEDPQLTPEEETQAITEFALLQLAEREGRKAPPEDLVFRPTDPFAAEATRDRAMARFLDQQTRRRGSTREPSPQSYGGNRQQAQLAPAGVKWTVGSRPRATPAGAEPARPVKPPAATRAKPPAPAKRTTKATAAKTTASKTTAAKTTASKRSSSTKQAAKRTAGAASPATGSPAAKRPKAKAVKGSSATKRTAGATGRPTARTDASRRKAAGTG